MARKRLGEILVQAGVLDASGLRAALTEQRRWGGPLGRVLVDMKLIGEDVLVQALSQQLNIPMLNVDNLQIAQEVLDLLPGELAEQHGVVPVAQQGKFLDVAMSDPTNLGIVDEVRIRTQLNVRPFLAGPKAIERAVAKHYGRGMVHVGWDGRGQSSQNASAAAPYRAAAQSIELEADPGDSMQVLHNDRLEDPGSMSRRVQLSAAQAAGGYGPPAIASPPPTLRDAEIAALQDRVAQLEALVHRDEDVLRKLLSLLVEKGIASRDEIMARLR
jgi:hypothetical protein